MIRRTVVSFVALMGLMLLSSPVFAQAKASPAGTDSQKKTDQVKPGTKPAPLNPAPAPAATEQEQPAPSASEVPADSELAMRQVPTVEHPMMTSGNTPRDAFMALAEDYIFLSEIGGRGPGRVPIWPRGHLKLGPVQVFPYLEGRLGWTNSIFDSQSSKSSWFWRAGGGVVGKMPVLAGRGTLHFGGDYHYSDYFSRNDIRYPEWTAGGGFTYRFPMGAWFDGGVKWEHLVNPVEIAYSGNLKRDQVYPYFTCGLDNVLGHKVNVEVGVDYTHAQFAGTAFDTADRNTWDAHVKASYPFIRQARVYVRYDYFKSDRQSSQINDLNNGNEVTGGLEGSIPITRSDRLTGTIGLGIRRDLYGAPTVYDSHGDRTDSHRNRAALTVHAALRYLVGPKTSVDARYLRTLEFSPTSNSQLIDRVDLSASHNFTKRLVGRVGGFFEYANPTNGGSYVRTGQYYSQPGDNYTRFGAGAGLRYLLTTNFDVDMEFEWSKRNTSKLGYDTHSVTASLGVTVYFQ